MRALLWVLVALWSTSFGSAAAQRRAQPLGAATPVNGVLVQFKGAPAHEQAARKAALSAGQVRAEAAHAARVRGALESTGLGAAQQRAFGRAALHLRWDQALSLVQAEQYAERLRQHPDVEWAEPNVRERRLQVPLDPMFAATLNDNGQWWLHPVGGSNANTALNARKRGVPGLQTAWATSTGSAAPVVAVLDTGITAHPDLDAHVLPGYDFVSIAEFAGDGDGRDADASDPGDSVTLADLTAHPGVFNGCARENSSWHGTNIAGIVAAVTNNAEGVAGINWNGRVLPVRVAGKCGAEVADIIDGMRWAAGLVVSGAAGTNPKPARVINISFGGTAACSPAYQSAIDELRGVGVVVVASAGNEHGSPTRPASCTGVIGVGALNRDGFKATYSNFGASLVVSTVGGDPVDEGRWGSTLGDDGLLTVDNFGVDVPGQAAYSRIAGTSFSAPIVAGTISLMLSVNPNLTATQIIAGLQVSARPHVVSAVMGTCSAQNPGRCICTTKTCGAGILDAQEALRYAQNPGAYVRPPAQAVNVDSADVVAAAALGPDLPANAGVAQGSSGGGAWSGAWLFGLLLATAALRGAGHPGERRDPL